MFTQGILISIPILGLIAGYVLQKVAPEEVKPGRPYFLIIQRILMAIIVGLLLYISPWSWKTIAALFMGAVLGYVFRMRYLYLGLAIVSVLAMPQELLLLAAALVFLYGLPFGTHKITKKPIFSMITHIILYGIPFLLLTTPFSLQYLPAVVAGALFLRE